MNINASLLFDCLTDRFSVLRFGRKSTAALLRPAFYEKDSALENNRVYVAMPDNLPPREKMTDNMLLICVEGLPSLAYQHSSIPMFVIRDSTIIEVFNEVLAIFERYDVWEKKLNNILSTGADLSELIQVTVPLLNNDITVVNKDLRVVAAANFKRNSGGSVETVDFSEIMSSMPLDITDKYRQSIPTNETKQGSFFSDDGCYVTNLYIEDQYWGNISLYPRLSPLRESDPFIFDILSHAVLQALQMNTIGIRQESSFLEEVSLQLLEGVAVDQDRLQAFESLYAEGKKPRFLFLCIQTPDSYQNLSPEYISQALRKRFPNLVLFRYKDLFVGIKDFADCPLGQEKFLLHLKEDLDSFSLKAGLSNPFHHLRHLRSYYQQALWTLELGTEYQKEQNMYHFRDYALRYMMLNSSGIFQARFLCPHGLTALQRYNEESEVDYWLTLRVYLDTERNIAHAAKALNIHRNTMIQRIDRMESILQMDLDDPMARLWLRIAIWLTEEEQKGNNLSKTTTGP